MSKDENSSESDAPSEVEQLKTRIALLEAEVVSSAIRLQKTIAEFRIVEQDGRNVAMMTLAIAMKMMGIDELRVTDEMVIANHKMRLNVERDEQSLTTVFRIPDDESNAREARSAEAAH